MYRKIEADASGSERMSKLHETTEHTHTHSKRICESGWKVGGELLWCVWCVRLCACAREL